MIFYGDAVLPDAWPVKAKLKFIPMSTAIFILYTSQGFVIAADGRQMKDEGENRKPEKDDVQKIFPIENPGRSLAYALAGTASIADKNDKIVVDFSSEIAMAAKRFARRRPQDLMLYAQTLFQPVYKLLLKSKRSGRIDYPGHEEQSSSTGFCEPGTMIANLFLFGYYEGNPVYTCVRFFHRDQTLASPTFQIDNLPLGEGRGVGSKTVWTMLHDRQDKVFSKYRTELLLREPPFDATIEEASEIAKMHVLACCDPAAVEYDKSCCAGIGGQIHIAKLTSCDGFEWIVAPKIIR